MMKPVTHRMSKQNEEEKSDMNDWFENEAFWVQYAPVMFDRARWAEAPTVAQEILKIAGIQQEQVQHTHILDAGCGLGRIAVELAACGAQVTGVDLIKPFLEAAADSAEAERVEIEWVQADLRNFIRPAAFDLAINVYTSFGYTDTIEEDSAIIRNIAQSLKPGGLFILEMLGREIAVRDFITGEWFKRAGYTVITEFSVVGAWEGLRSRWMLYTETGLKSDHTFVQRLYAATELRRLMLEAGFHTVEIYGDFDCSPYNEKARTMVLVGHI